MLACHVMVSWVCMVLQVMSDPAGGMTFVADPKKPVGGHVMAHASTQRVYMRKGKAEQRVAKVSRRAATGFKIVPDVRSLLAAQPCSTASSIHPYSTPVALLDARLATQAGCAMTVFASDLCAELGHAIPCGVCRWWTAHVCQKERPHLPCQVGAPSHSCSHQLIQAPSVQYGIIQSVPCLAACWQYPCLCKCAGGDNSKQ